MKKNIAIEGMSCAHCQGKVEKALNNITGVEAKVDLKKKTATVKFDGDVSDETLKNAVTDAGFTVVSIEEKKGIFGK
jgi:copper ion binding protein